MICIQVSKSTGKVTHTDSQGREMEISGLPPQASLKAILARIKVVGLKEKG